MGPCPCNRDRCDDEFLCHMIGRCRKTPVELYPKPTQEERDRWLDEYAEILLGR